MSNEIVKYESADGQEVSFTAQEVKERLCPNIDDKELALVMALCQAQKLNPFLKDVHIIKYGNSPASIVTSKEVFTKRAQANPRFEGMEAGVTFLTPQGQIVQREGSMPIDGWILIGGWCKVYVKGYRVPIYDEVSFSEYNTGKSNWAKMPGTMIRKVALCHALREAFPDDFQGLYGAEEMGAAELEAETQTTASYAEKTASNDESAVVAVAEFVEVASDEDIDLYIETVHEFADMCHKDWAEVHDAVTASTIMQGAGGDYQAWTPEQIQNAINQLNVWIKKSKEELKQNEELLEAEMAEEDIKF